MHNDIRWGILGCGRIARKFASDLRLASGNRLVAVGSRDGVTANQFAAEFQAVRAHQGYEALVADPEVDVIYVASPHGLHHQHVLLCLDHGKAVLCEKAFALNGRQAREMTGRARERKIFLMEALWTRFMPHFQLLREFISDGRLGELRSVLVNFGFVPQAPVPARLFDPALGGGSLLDIGIYNVFLALSVLGAPDAIEAAMTPASTGIDEQCSAVFRYRSGAIAQLFSTFSSHLPTEANISGTAGRIRLTHRFYEPSATFEFYTGRMETREIIPFEKGPGFGYQYEAAHVADCLRMGLTESPLMSHADTLLLMDTMDRIRSAAGIRYAVD